ncbi:MYND-type domain-containing protein [Mycena sanguinolenta]|uniref:MYND-type domain-containing protein n=1 Tax=Mycena sanguinolenta TaxID=230812 RepID=A0A8H7DP33_9AGAR|nr:MYND-type domain-containing protein [Mycena sanguinolenta]
MDTITLVSDISDIAPEHFQLLIPVLYAVLDPARISTILSRFDSSGWPSIKANIVEAYACLRGMSQFFNAISPGACIDLWQHVWPWIKFLDEFDGCLPIKEVLPVQVRYAASSTVFEELVTRTGGTRTDLASVVISLIKHVLPKPDSPVTSQTISHLVGTLYIISTRNCPSADHSFTGAVSQHPGLCTDCAESLFLCPSGSNTVIPPTWLPESLRAGLLDILFTPHHQEAISISVVTLLEKVFIPGTVYRSVLEQLRTSLAQVRDRDAAAIFDNAALLARWESFVKLVDYRLSILDQYTSGALAVPRACDDLECGKICSKQELKRCSGCLTGYYCSPICQGNDWQRGGHRQTCDDLSLRRIKYSHIPSGDRSFLRTLVYHEYTTRREEIAEKQLLFIRQHPGEVPYTMFAYLRSTCEITIGSLGNASDFEFEADRTWRSGGRIQLHLVKILEGTVGQSREFSCWPFPLRVSD